MIAHVVLKVSSGAESVSDFPTHCFPEPIANVINGLGPIVGSRPEFGGLAALFAGSLVAARVKVKVKTGWHIETNVYTAIVANKGEAKSPAIKFMCNPLFKHFGDTSQRYLTDMEKWEKDYAKAKMKPKKESEALISELEESKPEMPWWGIVTDGTVEGLRKVAGENYEAGHPSRIGRYNDELDGWIQSMNKYSEGGDMAFYLQAHDGDIHIKANKGEKSSCPPTTLSLIGTIQPEIFAQAFSGNNTHNGLLDRVMVSSPQGEAPQVDPFMEWDSGVLATYSEYILRLLGDMTDRELEMSEKCRDVSRSFHAWASRVDAKAKTGAMAKWWQHYFKVVGILTVLWGEARITVRVCELASELCKYFVACWVRSYKEMSRSDSSRAESRIISFLRENGLEQTYNDVKKKFHSRDRVMAEMALESLDESGRITISTGTGANGKRVKIVRLSLSEVD